MNEHETPQPSRFDSPPLAGRRIIEVRIPLAVGGTIEINFPVDHEIVGYYTKVELMEVLSANGQKSAAIVPIAVVLADQSLPETEIRRFFLAGVGTTVPEGAETLDCLAYPTNQGVRPAILFELPTT